jgi:very-short-patch-repair endonuclease
MRKALTPPEARLWVALKGLRAHGFHFRRQAPFRGWYLDFVCFERRLSIEVDGAHHYWSDTRIDRDLTRDAVLRREGFVVLRFTNADVRDHLEEVVDSILATLRQQCPTRPLRGHPPHEGEGEGDVDV